MTDLYLAYGSNLWHAQMQQRAWIYMELVHRPGPPAAEYVARLRHGYADFGFDSAPLEAALAAGG